MLKGLRHSDYERRKIASLQMEALGELSHVSFISPSFELLAETPFDSSGSRAADTSRRPSNQADYQSIVGLCRAKECRGTE